MILSQDKTRVHLVRHGVTITLVRATIPSPLAASTPEVGKCGGTLTVDDTQTPRRFNGAVQSGGHRGWNRYRARNGSSARVG